MKKILCVVWSITLLASTAWAQQPSAINEYKSLVSLQAASCKAMAFIFFSSMRIGASVSANESLGKIEECVKEAESYSQSLFKALDITLKTPDAKKAFREHAIANKVLMESTIPRFTDSKEMFDDRFEAFRRKRSEAWARFEIEVM